jgi:hypothetical protein
MKEGTQYDENIIGNKPSISGNHAFKYKRSIRSRKLACLMNEMEAEYNIPMLRTEEWKIINKAVFVLYRKISMSRQF